MAEVEDVRAGVEDVEIDVEGGDSSDDEEKAQEESLAPIPESQEQGCIKSLIFFPRAGGLSSLFGEEYQFVRRGREYHGYWEEYNVDREAMSCSL